MCGCDGGSWDETGIVSWIIHFEKDNRLVTWKPKKEGFEESAFHKSSSKSLSQSQQHQQQVWSVTDTGDVSFTLLEGSIQYSFNMVLDLPLRCSAIATRFGGSKRFVMAYLYRTEPLP